MAKFDSTFKYKVIYIFSINNKTHKGLLKIGDATVSTNLSIDKLFPNSSVLNKAANERIRSYTNTAGISYTLLYTELAIRNIIDDNGNIQCKAFRDHDVHKVLQNSGIKKKTISDTTGSEWFEIGIETAINAVEAVKQCKKSLLPNEIDSNRSLIIFRPEQEIAIKKTVKQFKFSNKMLWNAKMRFGKTLCALEVVKRMNFNRTIIVTHRPVVNDGWYNDFKNIFYNTDEFIFGSKAINISVDELINSNKNFVYFASVQDLRGSDRVGGKFDKNNTVFEIDWDFVVVDEAHEGTTTSLGEKVVEELVKENTKFLALSGTPFNIVDNYKEEELYTWDYVMEQRAKKEWVFNKFGDSNPYEELPELNIYTYNLGKILGDGRYSEIEDKAFNFKEFFRTWTGNTTLDFKPIPNGTEIGEFCHKQDVISFLNLITKENEESNYPYANEKYRKLFKHSLWMVPGVKEAKALSKLMKEHAVFGSGMFDIINVAGDGDEDEESKEALKLVKDAIAAASKTGTYTITISCGKLTTGVTIPEWTAVMMLSGSYSTSAANYLQTIFRVQSPGNIDGKIKENCFVFDFAPDRTLKMVADAVKLSTKAGKTSSNDRLIMGEFLNFCPVISIEGTQMQKYNENNLLQQLKRAYAERAVKNGFDDTSLYNDVELSKLTDDDLEKFKDLHKIVGANKASQKTKDIEINKTGLTDEEYEELESSKNKPPKERTAEEQARLDELKEKQSQRAKAISNLRAISIRIPLLIYGADVDFDEDITAERLVDIVDDSSWEEFMPTGMSKQMFKEFIKYYDTDVFIAAGRKIKNIVKLSDTLPPTERVQKIAELFSCFKNPDKETVLTPWRVVNMHMSDCLGGYSFYDEEYKETIEQPRFVDKGNITKETFANSESKILEINSKTGLYPLYVAYSIFRSKCDNILNISLEEQEKFWEDTIKNNVFVICKTPMAKAITKRTLAGYKKIKVNSHYFEDLINTMKNKPKQFIGKVLKPSYWNLKGSGKVKFDAIVGNPPYMEMDGGAQASASPIYQHFVQTGKQLKPKYFSFIMPTRWYAGGKGLDDFRDKMLNDSNLRELHDYLNPEQIFPNTNIRGGVCYFLWDKNYNNVEDLTRVVTHENNSVTSNIKRTLKTDGSDIFIRDSKSVSIISKVFENQNTETLSDFISPLRPFGFRGYFINDERFKETRDNLYQAVKCYGKGLKIGYVEKNEITVRSEWIEKWKVYIPRANNIGTELNDDNLNAFVGEPNTICTESYLVVGAELNLKEYSSKNVTKYLQTKFSRYLHGLAKASQDATSKTFKFVPLQDFTNKSDINWSKSISEIDKQLYAKYTLTVDEITYIESKIKSME